MIIFFGLNNDIFPQKSWRLESKRTRAREKRNQKFRALVIHRLTWCYLTILLMRAHNSAWDKSRDSSANSSKLEQMVWAIVNLLNSLSVLCKLHIHNWFFQQLRYSQVLFIHELTMNFPSFLHCDLPNMMSSCHVKRHILW